MAITNHERVGKALEFLTCGLKPFVERELKNTYQQNWFEETRKTMAASQLQFVGSADTPQWDAQALLLTLWNQWNEVFRKTLGQAERTLISELREVRNRWAHQRPFSTDDAYRALDSAARLLTAVSAPEASEVEKIKLELLRVRFDEQVRTEKRKSASTVVEGENVAGLKPWREVVTPHRDVASGKYQQAEFAADLWQVHIGEGSDEYRNPVEFFRRTFLTQGLRDLLSGALLRLSGQGGDPVIELQTNFGGGKTHSMLALYHMFCGMKAADLPGLEPVFEKSALSKIPAAKRVVIVGNKISPGSPNRKPDGTLVRTLWGELAWQLGGKEGYAMVKEDDERATSPGDTLRLLFNKYSPCVILIDEWVAYARQLHEAADLPGGRFETHFTFAQTLSEAAKAAKNTLLVVSIPSSESGVVSPHGSEIADVEVGGERGRHALERLKNAIGRVESSWRPASAEEGFEIVRRRLFEPITDPQLFVARDATAKAFMELYRAHQQEFPPECREADYEKRLKAAYPIHPEIFDRLYSDWSTLLKFQRTRGVLRLMAAAIHSLWEKQDRNPLIMPGSVPIDESRVQSELTRYLPDNWIPVIEKDVDGPNSLPLRIDQERHQMFGRYAVCRRVARTIYLGSAPTAKVANRGLEERRVKLGCVQPGESPAIFADALGHLTRLATYLYADGARYWYSTQPTVTKLAEDRAELMKSDPDAVVDEVKSRILLESKQRGDFSRVHPFPPTSADIPDDFVARLVILGVEYTHIKDQESPAIVAAKAMLENRGSSPRIYKNTLVFLASDKTRLTDLDESVRHYLAWNSIVEESEESEGQEPTLNLDAHQRRQAKTQRDSAQTTVNARIQETYQWLLVPTQTKPQDLVQWQAFRLQGQEALAVRASRKLKNDELLIPKLAASRLRLELDNVPLWRGDHVSIKQLGEDFARYLYLPRLRNAEVLVEAIRDGVTLLTWQQDSFAYADSFDDAAKRYRGLRFGQHIIITDDTQSGLLVKPDAAQKQFQAEQAATAVAVGAGASATPTGQAQFANTGETGAAPGTTATAAQQKPKRFFGSVKLNPQRAGRDAGKIAEEIIQHLTLQPGATVEVTLEIQAQIPEGAADTTVRVITENAHTLKFTTHSFEQE
ncbi:MAG: Swt1 family HEPN domain-containing protein [Verrucomicrobiota bacterium]